MNSTNMIIELLFGIIIFSQIKNHIQYFEFQKEKFSQNLAHKEFYLFAFLLLSIPNIVYFIYTKFDNYLYDPLFEYVLASFIFLLFVYIAIQNIITPLKIKKEIQILLSAFNTAFFFGYAFYFIFSGCYGLYLIIKERLWAF